MKIFRHDKEYRDRTRREYDAMQLPNKVDNNRRDIDALGESTRFLRNAITLWIIAFTSVSIAGYLANRHRIDDIQKSRLESCKSQYLGVQRLFEPQLKVTKETTPEEKEGIKQFKKRVRFLVNDCRKQVEPGRTDPIHTTPLPDRNPHPRH